MFISFVIIVYVLGAGYAQIAWKSSKWPKFDNFVIFSNFEVTLRL